MAVKQCTLSKKIYTLEKVALQKPNPLNRSIKILYLTGVIYLY